MRSLRHDGSPGPACAGARASRGTQGPGARTNLGFTYLGLLFLIALMGLTGAMAATAWSFVQQRSNERELVFAGQQFEAAIERYRSRSRPPAPLYPRRLEDLLLDERAPALQRDLRKVFVDPMTGQPRWGLIRLPDGGIVGVYSLSERRPIKRKSVAPGIASPQGQSYREWRFIAPSAAETVVALKL